MSLLPGNCHANKYSMNRKFQPNQLDIANFCFTITAALFVSPFRELEYFLTLKSTPIELSCGRNCPLPLAWSISWFTVVFIVVCVCVCVCTCVRVCKRLGTRMLAGDDNAVQASSFPSCDVAVLIIDAMTSAMACVMVFSTTWLSVKTRQYAVSQWTFWGKSLAHFWSAGPSMLPKNRGSNGPERDNRFYWQTSWWQALYASQRVATFYAIVLVRLQAGSFL